MSKLWASTFFWAPSMERVSQRCSMGSPSSMPSVSISLAMRSDAKMRIRSSSRDRKKREEPGSPWRPARPRSWLSMRRDSCRSVPRMCRPPAATTSSCSRAVWILSSSVRRASVAAHSTRRAWKASSVSPSMGASGSGPTSCFAIISGLPPSRMSVPRPAMLVEMVTAPLRPAWATISASRSWCLAFRTLWGMPRFFSSAATTSLFATETVPTSTGWPFPWRRPISSPMALNFSRSVL